MQKSSIGENYDEHIQEKKILADMLQKTVEKKAQGAKFRKNSSSF